MTANLDLSHFAGIGLGLALGLLVGIQRGWSQRLARSGTRFAGIRTFALFGLAGGIAGALYAEMPAVALVILLAAAALVVAGYRRSSRPEEVSGTGSMVGLLTLAGGFIGASGEPLLAISIVVAMVLLLAMREPLHHWLQHLSEAEVLAIARFALIAAVILPLLPDAAYGPYDAWNPRQLWLVVVLVSGFSFAGYFGAKWLGATRGMLATAAAGAMVSSTAVTASLARQMRPVGKEPANLAAAISLASGVMFVRVLLLVAVLAPFALLTFAKLVAPGMVLSFACAAWFLRRARQAAPDDAALVKLRNPFDLWPALVLAGMVMVLTLAARWVLASYGNHGVALVLALSGTVDVDSAIITMGGLPAGTLAPGMAAAVLAVPVTLNTVFKGGLTIALAGWTRGQQGFWPLFAVAATVVLSWLAWG